jgi:E3 ubiquitin-protein ligase synoviolin
MRDLFLTARSFFKRLTAFLRYRRATHDMNQRYPDATVEELQREDTCIICREEMTPWSVTNPPEPPVGVADAAGQVPGARPRVNRVVNERTRPKKLPCGHVLHLGCLKSWLERQQVCPTCRSPVVDVTNPPGAQVGRPGQPAAAQIPGQPQVAAPAGPNQVPGPGQQPNARMRMINFGPIRFGFGQAPLQDIVQQFGGAQQVPHNGAQAGAGPTWQGVPIRIPPRLQPSRSDEAAPGVSSSGIQAQLEDIEERIMNEIRDLQVSQQELQVIQLLQAELSRLRAMQGNMASQAIGNAIRMPQMQPPPNLPPFYPSQTSAPIMQRHQALPGIAAIPSGHADLPEGITIPEGWTLLPLEPVNGAPSIATNGVVGAPSVAVSSQPAGIQPTPTVPLPTSTSASGLNDTIGTFSDTANTIPSQAPLPGFTSPSLDFQDIPRPVQSLEAGNLVATPSEPSLPTNSPAPSSLDTPGVQTVPVENLVTPHPSASTGGADSGSEDPVTNIEDEHTEPRKDKGKARATTVEEATDEDL